MFLNVCEELIRADLDLASECVGVSSWRVWGYIAVFPGFIIKKSCGVDLVFVSEERFWFRRRSFSLHLV